jgi:putative ABC transport system substrate-binding protein
VIGWLNPGTKATVPAQLLRDSLAKHGLVVGTSIRLEIRLGDGNPDRLPGLAEELVSAGATVIFASGETAARAAQQATQSIPIVTGGDDLVGSGLVASLSQPGGNVTGVSILATELDAKRIEVLKELLPHARRIGVLNDPESSGPGRPRAIADTARRLGVALQVIDIRGPDDLETAFQALRVGGADGVNIVSSATLFGLRPRLAALSLAARIPAICQFREMVEAGCLASYGIELADLYGLLSDQIARILKGAKPADLPVIQPSRFELAVNLKTAKALGITIPSLMLARAAVVVE